MVPVVHAPSVYDVIESTPLAQVYFEDVVTLPDVLDLHEPNAIGTIWEPAASTTPLHPGEVKWAMA